MMEANDKLELIRLDIIELSKTMDAAKTAMENIEQSTVFFEETNEEIKDMNLKLEEVSNKATEALDLADKVDDYMGNLMIILSVGVIAIILGLLTLIGAVIAIKKR